MRLKAFYVLVLVGLLLSSRTYAEDKSESGMIKSVSKSVVRILTAGETQTGEIQATSSGSGVIVDEKGLVLTALHVVKIPNTNQIQPNIYVILANPDNPYQPISQNNMFKGTLEASSAEYDLALLKIGTLGGTAAAPSSQKFPALAIANSQKAEIMEKIYVLGFPLQGGSTINVNSGEITGRNDFEGWIKTNAQILHGVSGGAAVDKKGKLIGIASNVMPDVQNLDTNQDGFPDLTVNFGSIGYIRQSRCFPSVGLNVPGLEIGPSTVQPSVPIEVSGRVVSQKTGENVPNALVGLLKLGAEEISQETVLTYGRCDGLGNFVFKHPVPQGTYDIKVVAQGYPSRLYKNIKIDKKNTYLKLEL